MKYFEIDKTNEKFSFITLENVLLRIQCHIDNYIWSIQLIDGVGHIKNIVGMDIVELENYCDESHKGFILNFQNLLELSRYFKDIIDILIIGCESLAAIPKAYKDNNWEEQCEVIISREDSSLWQFYAKKTSIIQEFKNVIS